MRSEPAIYPLSAVREKPKNLYKYPPTRTPIAADTYIKAVSFEFVLQESEMPERVNDIRAMDKSKNVEENALNDKDAVSAFILSLFFTLYSSAGVAEIISKAADILAKSGENEYTAKPRRYPHSSAEIYKGFPFDRVRIHDEANE